MKDTQRNQTGPRGAAPLVFVFFGALAIFFLAGLLWPQHTASALENRSLAQKPAFSWEGLLQGKWLPEYADAVRDQFPGRDTWAASWGFLQAAQGKLETGGIWLAKDGYQIVKNSILTESQAQKLTVNETAVCELAARHPGKVEVMIVPSPANILQNELSASPPQIDENAILDSMFANYTAAGASVIDLRPAFLQAHSSGQQVYYRTDHHWTTTGGAWLAYREFCLQNNREPVIPPPASLVEVSGFYGTNYTKTARFATQPDTLAYYDFDVPLTIFKYQNDGSIAEEPGPLMDTEKLQQYDKYAAFLRGNNGYSEMQGSGEGSILVIKDSYGNSFVPYLLQTYAKVGIIDLRYWLSVDSTIESGGYDKILVLYSFTAFSNDMYANRMLTALQK